jgi:hypothetical protein
MQKFLPQSFNDLLCLFLIFLIVGFWTLQGLQLLELPAEVTGALIVTWTLLVQYYFRKRPNESTRE